MSDRIGSMTDKMWPAVVGTALVSVAVLLVGGAVIYLGASGLSVGVGEDKFLVLFFVLPLVLAAGAIGGAVTLLSRSRPERWGRHVAIGVATAPVVVAFCLFVLPELMFPNA